MTGLQFVLQSESNASDTAELSPMGSMTGDCVTTVLTGGSIEKIQASYSEDNKSVTAIKYYKTDGAKTFGELENSYVEWSFSGVNRLMGIRGRTVSDYKIT